MPMYPPTFRHGFAPTGDNLLVRTTKQPRKPLYPSHSFHIHHNPFAIVPYCIAPVLAGETLKRALFQTRAVPDVVKSPLTGWWLEHFLFYVKLSDLGITEADFHNMLIDPNFVLPDSYKATAYSFKQMTAPGQVKWLEMCLKRVVETYFRPSDGSVAWDAYTDNHGYPMCRVNVRTWSDSLSKKADLTDEAITLSGAVQDTDMAMADAISHWEFLQQTQLSDMTYEDYLRSFGVSTSRIPDKKPELLRYNREWTLPSNTIDASDGSPSSAISWVVNWRADKDRFFEEPGFLFAATVSRPKTLSQTQKGSIVGDMDRAVRWLPSILADSPYTSLVAHDAMTGPIPGATEAYIYDLRDLFLYGDYFCNLDPDTPNDHVPRLNLPKTSDINNADYPVYVDIQNIFRHPDEENPGEATQIKQDGIIQFNILGTQQDYTA